MATFAQQLAIEAERRRQFVAQNRQDVLRLKERYAREREQTAQQIRGETAAVVRMLQANTRTVKQHVARTLDTFRTRRFRLASDRQMMRRQVIGQIRREVASSLQRSQSLRARAARQQSINASQLMQQVRRKVAEVRNDSVRITSSIASELRSGRQALASARRRFHAELRSSESTPNAS
jgi:hypothetical protein